MFQKIVLSEKQFTESIDWVNTTLLHQQYDLATATNSKRVCWFFHLEGAGSLLLPQCEISLPRCSSASPSQISISTVLRFPNVQ